MKSDSTLQGFFVAGGTLWREAPSYIIRPADEELYRHALAGEYCNVLAARQMGKSSLMVRTAERLREAGVRTAILDVSTLGVGISTPEAWFFGFLDELAVQLDLEVDAASWWQAHSIHNPVHRFSTFLRDVVLAEIPGPMVVFVDEIDSALGMAFTDDFFAAIRGAYNSRASYTQFQQLTFILLGVARPADLIYDRNRTPYNIGTHILLSDFTLPELRPFQDVFEAYFPAQGKQIVAWVLEWTNGQPYLTQKLCAELTQLPAKTCTRETVDQTVSRLFFLEEARKESNLRAIRDRIESSPHKTRMLQLYGQILRRRPVPDEERSPAKNELKLTGLVRASAQGRLEVRNRIYQEVFDLAWVRRNLPQSQSRQVVLLASLITIVAFVIAGFALYRQRIQPSLTFAEEFQNSNSPDVKLTSLARLVELENRSDLALELYNGLAHQEKLSLFTGLSSPQNVAGELVTVIETVYQEHENNQAGNDVLDAMRTVLGQIGAAGAPSLKTEIEFWLKGREEANQKLNPQIAASFYDSAWAESAARGHPNYAVRYDRARALITLKAYTDAVDDLQVVWEKLPGRQDEIEALILANPELAMTFFESQATIPEILAFITPILPATAPPPTASPAATQPVAMGQTQVPSPSLTPTPAEASPYAGWFAFGRGEGTGREIYLTQPGTGQQIQLTANGVIDEAPSFSGDNWQVVYGSNRTQGGWELYAYDLRAKTERQLTAFDGEARFPAWSPVPGDPRILFEGRKIEQQPVINIYLLDSVTGTFTQLTDGGADSRPVWSPDGSQFLFSRATADTTGDGRVTTNDFSDIYIFDIATQEVRNLTNSPDTNDSDFDWSPDGEWIVFTSVRSDVTGDGVINLSDSQDLYLIRKDGSDERRLDLNEQSVFSPSWSPDGRFILVLVNHSSGVNEIMRYDTQNGRLVTMSERGPFFHPVYSH